MLLQESTAGELTTARSSSSGMGERENVTTVAPPPPPPPVVVGGCEGLDAAADGQPQSPATRLFHQPQLNCHIIAMMGSSNKIDVSLIKTGISATLLRHPRFCSLQVDGRWVRITAVAAEDHVVVPDLSFLDSSSGSSHDAFVEDYISELSTTTFDFSRPLWDLHILNVRTSEAEATAVLRMHHSLGDGMSLVSFLLASFRKASDPAALPTLPETRRRGWGEKGRAWWVLLRLWLLARVAWNTLEDFAGLMATSRGLQDSDTPIKGGQGVENTKKRFVHKTVSFDHVKFVKHALDATVNDVLMGMTSAGLTRYLTRRYARERGTENGKLPENLRVRSTVLVNVRKAPGLHALADMMKGTKMNAPWGNWIGYIILPLPIVQYDNPLDYVRTARNIVNRKKASHEAFLNFWSTRMALKILGVKKAASVCHRVLSNTTLTVSNVIGPLEEVCFCGHRLVYLAPTVYGQPYALTIHFQSYMGKVEIVLAVDETIIPDPHQLCDDIITSLDLMKSTTASSAAPEV